MSSTKSFTEVNEVVEKWWRNLQFERKCNSTNFVQKVVSNSSPEIQEKVQQVICQEIKKLIEKCFASRNLNDLQCACNAINGCFDNFVQAVEAVRFLFSEVISLIDFGLAECQAFQLCVRANQKNTLLELLHSLSRILILVLKLKRTQKLGKVKNSLNSLQRPDSDKKDLLNTQNYKCVLSFLSYKIGKFLIMDDILIDTKNNLAMSGILIRELLAPDENALIEFHKNFIKSIPVFLSDENRKLNILKFLTCSAIINTWSVNIIDNNATFTYLKFFIFLSEKYSSETSVVLNTSRTLLLLIKHDSFKKFVSSSNGEQIKQIIPLLLSCIFMLLEHPVPCVRHSAKDFLQLLAAYPSLHSTLIEAVFKLPTDKRSYFISVGALANEIGTEILIINNNELPKQMIAALHDPTIVSHVSLALEYVILNDSLAEKNFSKWCETWIMPLLISLINVFLKVAADIEKLLEKAFKKYPDSIIYIIEKWANPASGEELRYVITALRISQKYGFKFKTNSSSGRIERKEGICEVKNYEDPGKGLISEKLLEQCLHQRDDDIRISAFSLLIEAHKSTQSYSETDFKLILYFLQYNLNNQQPSARQKILGLIRKMLMRYSESKASLIKPSKNVLEQAEKSKCCLTYDCFMASLTSFCFSNIFVGCNFNRLNTVLNILFLCFENVKDMSFNRDMTDFYWNKFLIALNSSYEENKALAVILAHKLDFSMLKANKPSEVKLLYEKAFNLCTHMEPPDVLTGSYLLQILIKLPSSKEVLSAYFIDKYVFDDVSYCCIQVLVQKLKEQIQLAKLDLMTAATCGPMYGVLFAIRLIFKNLNFSKSAGRQSALAEWGQILSQLVDLSFGMIRVVSCVVNSSSPEGHLPMDFQTDFESLLSVNFREKCQLKGGGDFIQTCERSETTQLIELICSNFLKKCNKLQSIIEGPDCDSYESLRSLNALLKENQLLIHKVQTFYNTKQELSDEKNSSEEFNLLRQLKDMRNILEQYAEKLQNVNSIVEWPATAQVLLLCAWRSIKEASLYLGDLVSKLPIETEIILGLVSKDTIVRIGEELKMLLCEIKHRGAFEHAYIGFIQLVSSLWKCSDKNLSDLPRQWLVEIISQLESPLKDQKVNLCSTRRSAGLPFLVQAIICSEVFSVKSTTPSSLHTTMKSLFGIIENGVAQNPESKIHALNVLRALFKHAQLGEHVASYVSKALRVAICGSRADTWSERNSSSLLFSSLFIRIFGVSRSREEISKKNRMTSRTFFQRYSELYDFLLSEMELVCLKKNEINGIYPKPSLYLVLLILGRLYPPPTEDPDNIDLSEFLPYINMCRKNPVMKIRELGARALVPLISRDRLLDEIDNRFSVLSSNFVITNNERHGILLQILELLSQPQEIFKSFTNESLQKKETIWIEKTKWMFKYQQEMPLIIHSSYVKVLHVMFKNFTFSREKVSEIITSSPATERLLKCGSSKRSLLPGIHIFLENLCFLKTDILASQWLLLNDCHGRKKFFDFFLFMMNCEISEVQSIPLRILCHILRSESAFDVDSDDFSGIAAPVTDLLLFKYKERVDKFKIQMLSNGDVLERLTKEVNSKSFSSTIIKRIWLTVVSTLVLNGIISISNTETHISKTYLRIEQVKPLIRSGDKDLSNSALICHALYLMEKVSRLEAPIRERFELSDILHEFSRSDADVKERLAVAKIMNRFCKSFMERHLFADPVVMNIWMIPFKLIADEDSEVRLAIGELVHAMQDHIRKEIPTEKLLIKMRTLDWPHLALVSLKAQECLLDSFINILGNENLLYLFVQMLIAAISSLGDVNNSENYSKDEFGVFEKGNPNPYCEDLALSNLMCQKIRELRSVVDLNNLMFDRLNDSLRYFIAEKLQLTDRTPQSLTEVVETVTTLVDETDKLKGEYNLFRIQMKNLRESLGLPENVS